MPGRGLNRVRQQEEEAHMHLSQIETGDGGRAVVARNGDRAQLVNDASGVLALAQEAIAAGTGLGPVVERHGLGEDIDLVQVYAEGRFLPPVTHPDPAHTLLTGTGLTHLGSASTRDSMHQVSEAEMTDSMKMFRMGLENGKPAPGETGVQPEWFYKGSGQMLAAAGEPLVSPSFALDGGEEPEIAGLYLIGPDGTPFRIGWALANEFSDHVTERQNYLYLAHSKLRPAAVGPELLVGDLPRDIRGTSRILRDGDVLWEKPFLSGEDNMSHSFANLEHHHFKYEAFRNPGDLHVHMFGTATLSVADGIETRAGDVFEIEAETFGLALKNPLEIAPVHKVAVRAL